MTITGVKFLPGKLISDSVWGLLTGYCLGRYPLPGTFNCRLPKGKQETDTVCTVEAQSCEF